MESNISVQGVDGYTITKTTEANKVSVTLTLANGETFVFAVQENITNEFPKEKKGCSSSLTAGNVLLTLSALAFVAVFARRRKHYE